MSWAGEGGARQSFLESAQVRLVWWGCRWEWCAAGRWSVCRLRKLFPVPATLPSRASPRKTRGCVWGRWVMGEQAEAPLYLCRGLRGSWASSEPPFRCLTSQGCAPPPAQKLAASLSLRFPGRPGKGMTCLDVFALRRQPTSVLISLMYSFNNRFREASWRC